MPKVLYVTPLWAERPTSAAEVRALQVGYALRELGHVEMLFLDEPGGDDLPAGSEQHFNATHRVPVQLHPNTTLREKLSWMLDPRREYPFGCRVANDHAGRVLRMAAEFDLVWFFKLRSPDMLPQWRWPRSVVDIDDVPSTYERTVLSSGGTFGDRVHSGIRGWTWRRRERLLSHRFKVLCTCSEADKRYLRRLGCKAAVHVIPNGYERPATMPLRQSAVPARIGFIGVFDYWPNAAGIEWFIRNCWPRVKREVPDARLRLVGRGSDGPSTPAGSDIDALGSLADPNGEIATWAAMVVPLQVGAGTRGKIAHAFSQKCPVVSTSLGAYGYDAKDGQNMYIADAPEAFAAACINAIKQPVAAAQVAERAWMEFLHKWTWESIRPKIKAAAEDCLARQQ